MTEAEWLGAPTGYTATQVIELMFHRTASRDGGVTLHVSQSERKLRLFACACCIRQVRPTMDTRIKDALTHACRFAEQECGREELGRHHALAQAVVAELSSLQNRSSDQNYLLFAAWAVMCASTAAEKDTQSHGYASSCFGFASQRSFVAAGFQAEAALDPTVSKEEAYEIEANVQIALLRDIFENPFRPAAFAPIWRTSTVIAIARHIYDSREFSPMPILGDALEDAGCDNEDILNHCRGDGPHVRGCWVVDLVLGKE